MADQVRPLALDDLADLELLLPLQGTAYRDELDAATRPLGITLLPAAEIDGLRLIASLTFEGFGPAILPATAIPGILRHTVPSGPHQGPPPTSGRRRPAQSGAALRTDPCPQRTARRGGGRRRRATRRCPREHLTTYHSHPRRRSVRLGAPRSHSSWPDYASGTPGSRHMRQIGGAPTLLRNSSITSKPKRA